jgi:hypothetical protein
VELYILPFEGPDPHARTGAVATRGERMARALADLGLEIRPRFVRDADPSGREQPGDLQLHPWAQWVVCHHPRGGDDGEEGGLLQRRALQSPMQP